jgi:predicted amidohydrolase
VSELALGICQLRSRIGRDGYDPRPDNLAAALDAIAQVHEQGAQVAVFGEVFLNGYQSGPFTPAYAVAEREDDPWVEPLAREARERDLYVIMGATTHKGVFPGDVYNSALVLGPEGLLGVYSKTHVAGFAVEGADRIAAERVWWSPGDALPVFDTAHGRIAVEICYDVMFPEVARTYALRGAELVVNISAAICGFEELWGTMVAARATENALPILHVSVVGRQHDLEFFGGSRLFGPSGELLHEAPRGEEALQVATLDRSLLWAARGASHPFANRNPRLYGELAALRPLPQPSHPRTPAAADLDEADVVALDR